MPVELSAGAFWLLIAAGTVSGMLCWSLFGRWFQTGELHRSFNRIVAHLFELRLFSNEPRMVIRTQRDLLAANGQLMRRLAGPTLILLAPSSALFLAMDAWFGRAPLQIGAPAVVTMQFRHNLQGGLSKAELQMPNGMEIETGPVRIPFSSQVVWRVRPVRASSGELRIAYAGRVITKNVSSKPGLQWLSDTRAASPRAFLRHPVELPASSDSVDSISIAYPRARVLGRSWMTWFSAASILGLVVAAAMSLRPTLLKS